MEDLGEWYQTIDIDGNLTKGRPGKGDVRKGWETVKQFLPETLEGMRILDLGCNAGGYCINSILMGAEEVVGIDLDVRQALFVKGSMEKKHNRKMNIHYIHGKVQDHIKRMGVFDVVYAFSVLYHLPDEVCVDISKSTGNIIARLRKGSDLLKYSKIFKGLGFRVIRPINQTNKRFFVQYVQE